MDGSHRTTIVQESVCWPNGITLDLVMERIYWIDAKLNLVGSANMDGTESRYENTIRVLGDPFKLHGFDFQGCDALYGVPETPVQCDPV